MVSEYKNLHEKDESISTLEVTDEKGIVLVRSHNPQKRGDYKSKLSMLQKALAGEPTKGIIISPTTGEIAFNAVYPIKFGDKVIGTFKIGSYFKEGTVKYLKSIANMDIIFFIGSKINFTTLKEASELTLNDEIYRKMKSNESIYDVIKIGGQKHNVTYIPLIDSEGNKVGAIAGLISWRDIEKSMPNLLISQIIIALIVLVIFVALVAFMVRNILVNLLRAI